MGESKHTPGPWRAEPLKRVSAIVSAVVPPGRRLTMIGHFDLDAATEEEALAVNTANATLAAAAPELLQELQALLVWCEQHGNAKAPGYTTRRMAAVNVICKAGGPES